MTSKTILALAQAHRLNPTVKNYAALASAVRGMEEELQQVTAMYVKADNEREDLINQLKEVT